MPPAFASPHAREGSPVCVRVGSRRRAAWEAALEPGESLSSLIRGAVEAELEHRREEAELEAQRREAIAADPLARFDLLLERARRAAAG